jgi:hypothetical protein
MWSALTVSRGATELRPQESAELKDWARRLGAERPGPRHQAAAVAQRLMAPWRFAREAARVLPEYAPFVAARFHVPARVQVRQVIWVRLRYQLDPIAYYRFQLYRPERWKHAADYVQNSHTGPVLRWLVAHTHGYERVFGDKRAFELWCVQRRLPCVRSVMVFENGQLHDAASPDAVPPPCDLFSKPSNSCGGEGTEKWSYRPDGSYLKSDGTVFGPRALLDELAKISIELGRPVIVQRSLGNPGDLPRTPGALCTVRLTTVCPPRGEPSIAFAVFRLPAEARCPADNFSAGGISCPVEISSGRLLPGVRKNILAQPHPVPDHPLTGERLAGRHLPRWDEAKELALRAHRAITWDGVPVLGWDVALLEDGPVLIEGNNIPCSTFAQMVLERPLSDLSIVSCINAHMRERFGAADRRT